MKRVCTRFLVVLLFWFTLDMTGFSIGDIILVEAAWKSDGVFWLVFVTLVITFVIADKFGKYPLTLFVLLWAIIQYSSHWHYTLFGASEEKTESYNQYFKDTYHIIESTDTMIFPDLYHIILHLFIVATLISLIRYCFYKKNCNKRIG